MLTLILRFMVGFVGLVLLQGGVISLLFYGRSGSDPAEFTPRIGLLFAAAILGGAGLFWFAVWGWPP